MDQDKTVALASQQLDRVLEFFARVDSKASFLFAIDTGLLALLCTNLKPHDLATWYVSAAAVLAILLIFGSLWFLYRCSFPSLNGGAKSLIYFREIASRTEATFIDEYSKATHQTLGRDILGQIWRNSEILKMKFDALKSAFILAALALVPWAVFLTATAILHAQIPVVH